ncbi:uncharacterized protein LOC128746050 [Sabethes cyaneus]|uniref:uncharacterized protein LOC128746050 n=1 Tax=Sabethes cyaneus TaxID=53552 RepID=UPI00237DECA1|nr:uncharacterized protein LOC128746050 [Sabethes cyaneus]
MLVNELVDKLPPNYKLDWVRYKREKTGTPLRVFTDFMNDIVADVSEVSEFSAFGLSEAPSFGKGKPRKKEFANVHSSTPSKTEFSKETKVLKPCWVCKRTDHKLRFCDDFKRLSIADRWKTVEQNRLCPLCLNNHGNSRCSFKVRCNVGGCRGEHHSLLHRIERAVQLLNVECHAHGRLNRAVIFRVVPVTLYFRNYAMDVLAFLDEGSSTTLVEEFVVNELNAEGVTEPLVVTWTSNVKRYENRSKKFDLKLSARGSREMLPLKNVRSVISLKLPSQAMPYEEITDRYSHLKDLPVMSYALEEPRIIIGLDNLHVFAPLETRVGEPGQPIAVRSKLGWTIYGPENCTAAAESFVNVHSVEALSNEDLYEMLRAQYLLEDTGTPCNAALESAENLRAREILQTTTTRIGDRFETGLLWREDIRSEAKNPELQQNVQQQIVEYEVKGYAHKITKEELAKAEKSAVWYLPLNVVVNPRKPGKVRLVWDAAASVNGISLNTELLKGPDMLQSLPSVINHFRERRIAFGGDIQEMYHQIRIRAEDRQAQRFLFRSSPADVPTVYVMDVATFGATCSPCSAQFVKNVNAAEFANEFPRASDAVARKHYVDDYYDSVDSIDDAIRLANEVKHIHSRGGFRIRNWVSNSQQFLEAIGEQKVNPAVHFSRDKNTQTERVLGIVWEPEEDVFLFSTTGREEYQPVLQGVKRPTKRIVLSCVMAMFDPQGLLSPFTVFGRMLVQDLWRTGCDWDEEIDDESFQKWIRWTKVLPMIEEIRIPRSYFGDARADQIEDLQLHVVSDASKGAYGCAAYFRAVVGGIVQCVLVTSRVKVAPLKPVSVPRLELQAAVLGARIALAVRDGHSLEIRQRFFWTDSTTVLSWIRSDQRKYKEFVGLRIGEILTCTNLSEWRWVPTRMNVADQLTKWTKDPEISSTSAWFTGPRFLYLPEADWPQQKLPRSDTEEELRAHLHVHDVQLPAPVIDVTRISKWTVLVRTLACVFRFVSNCRRKLQGLPLEMVKPTKRQAQKILPIDYAVLRTPLKQNEYEEAENWLMRMAQAEAFSDELKILMKNSNRPAETWLEIEKSSFLYKLTPLIDENGLLRMEGRTGPAKFLPFDLRFPIILPKDHVVTWKIVQHYHERFGHGYRETVKNELRQRFVIPQVGSVVAKVAKACIQCKVTKCRPRCPRMAALPVQRVTPYLRPFCFVGIDYFGPITVSCGRRSEKRWIVLFTCLVVRAVHLEVAHSLTTQSCLMAINRFIAHRGPPLEVFTDNGTNFKGASKEVEDKVHSINEDCAEDLTSSRMKWNFNPPASPHMGGVWERLVRSTKDVLGSIDDGKRLTDEILATAIAEAAEIVNSRPLTYVAQESDHLEALTPNHFLRGIAPNEPRFNVPPVNPAVALRDSYHRSQEIADEMWKRWIRECVPSINHRTKWFSEAANLKKGDLVYIVEGDKRKCWVRGLVEEPIVAGDGRVRQAWIRTHSGVLKRATAKLAVLEISEGDAGPDVLPGPGSRAGACCGRNRRAGNAVTVANWLGEAKFFLGLELHRDSDGVYSLSVKSYIKKLIAKLGLENAKIAKTPMDQGFLKDCTKSEVMKDGTKYRSIVGALMYIAVCARPDIAASASILGRRFSAPTEIDWTAAKRVVRYLKGTIDWELKLGGIMNEELLAYSDADWAGDPQTRKSMTGFVVFFAGGVVSWASRRQDCVSLSSMEAEFVASATNVKK